MAANGVSKNPVLLALALYCACLLAAALTEILWTIPGSGISIWLPAGILLSVLLVSPHVRWPLLAGAAISAELTGNLIWYGHEIGPALLLALGNSLAVTAGAIVIRKLVPSPPFLATTKDTAIFLTIAGVGVPILSATTASIGLGWSYGRPWTDFWQRIFLGDATGAIIAAPIGMLLLKVAARRLRISTGRLRELSALIFIFGAMRLFPSAVLRHLPI